MIWRFSHIFGGPPIYTPHKPMLGCFVVRESCATLSTPALGRECAAISSGDFGYHFPLPTESKGRGNMSQHGEVCIHFQHLGPDWVNKSGDNWKIFKFTKRVGRCLIPKQITQPAQSILCHASRETITACSDVTSAV